MLAITNLNYNIGSRVIYEGANLHIKPKDKIGLIGLNGTGKSTLLKMIVGDITPDGGEISSSKDCTIGFLNQDLLSYQSAEPILDVAMKAFSEALDVHHKIDKVLAEMETNYRDELVEKLTKLQERFEALDGYTIQSKAEEILEGIGFSTADLKRPLKEFSGGWRMRVMLAKLLLEKPSLLMLDEPTNHLDLPSIQWVENYLKSYEGAVIVVSHDRHFINNTVNMIVEVTANKLNVYAGNYEFYLEEKDLRNEIQKNAFENQQSKIRQTERFIERFRAKASKSRQVQSRVKTLQKMDVLDDVLDENAKVNFRFNFTKPSGRHVIQLRNVSKSYGDQVILKHTDAHIERGDKIALIGANGKGKSTLLRIISGNEKFEGERQEGFNVVKSFYAQHQLEALNVNYEILEEMKAAGTDKTEMQLRSVLGCFLFSDDDVFKKIKVLSGGEKSRVALAKTLISEANFLLLDEPTNHLDIQSVNILIQALQQYEGSFIVVSHDRYFVTEIANKIWYIENNEIKTYPGTYEEYNWWREQQALGKPVPQDTIQKKEPRKEKPVREPDEERELQKELKALQKRLSEIESNIIDQEISVEEAEKELSLPNVYESPDLLAETTDKYKQAKLQLEKFNESWEEIGLKIETLEKQLV